MGGFGWYSLFLVIMTVAGALATLYRYRCPPGWIPGAQSCWAPYLEDDMQGLNSTQAQEACLRMGGSLAVPDTKAERDFIGELFAQTWPEPARSVWLGCTASLPDNALTCTPSLAGSGGGFLGFFPSSYENERCVVLPRDMFQWQSRPCRPWAYIVCERPATLATAGLRCSAVDRDEAGVLGGGSRCLLNHSLAVAQTASPVLCCIACFENAECHSFNLSGKTCRLNNVTKDQVDQDKFFKSQDGCGYFEMQFNS